jgi:hypothetical protein
MSSTVMPATCTASCDALCFAAFSSNTTLPAGGGGWRGWRASPAIRQLCKPQPMQAGHPAPLQQHPTPLHPHTLASIPAPGPGPSPGPSSSRRPSPGAPTLERLDRQALALDLLLVAAVAWPPLVLSLRIRAAQLCVRVVARVRARARGGLALLRPRLLALGLRRRVLLLLLLDGPARVEGGGAREVGWWEAPALLLLPPTEGRLRDGAGGRACVAALAAPWLRRPGARHASAGAPIHSTCQGQGGAASGARLAAGSVRRALAAPLCRIPPPPCLPPSTPSCPGPAASAQPAARGYRAFRSLVQLLGV